MDYTSAIFYADIKDEVYVDMPRGFKIPGKVLKLKKSLYGLRQSPRNFFLHLKNKMENVGFVQSDADPCLFVHQDMICLVYVDDCLFFAPDDSKFEEMLEKLRGENLTLEREDDVAGFLGVKLNVSQESGTVELLQSGLIDRIITAMGLENANSISTPAEYGALPKDEEGEPCNEDFNYPAIVGMLLYLQGHSRPNIAFATAQCARYSFCPKMSYEKKIKRIGGYLVGTRSKGLIMTPNNDLNVDCCVDSVFADLWSYEEAQDPTCVKSRTGYVVLMGNCPVMWTSKLQTEISLSTMEAEYVAMSTAMRELIPLKRLIVAVSKAVGVKEKDTVDMLTRVWEDNEGCLKLAKLEPPRMMPRSKHYALKYHWFRSQIVPNNITLLRIKSEEQLADIFTKGLRKDVFEIIRKLVMGW